MSRARNSESETRNLKKRICIGNAELKGDVHPIQCPVNALGEVNEEYTYGKASRTADVTDGEIIKNHLRHLPLGLSVYKLLLNAI